MTHVVAASRLGDLFELLREGGRRVVGPVVRDGVITHDEIDDVEQLPRGWTEEQEPGRYRLAPTGTDELFAFSAPSTSWKSQVYPEKTLLIRATRAGDDIVVEEPEVATQSTVFFGIRSCDLAGLGVLDRVFGGTGSGDTGAGATDPTYAALRADVFIVAVACGSPGNTCFCASMDTGPTPSSGYDLSLRELYEEGRHEFLIEAGSEQGADVLERLGAAPVDDSHTDLAQAQHRHAVASMSRGIDPAHPPLAAAQPEHPAWNEIAEQCLSCGNCTMVCPTCFCGTTEDTTDLTGTRSERWRVWDSCFSLDHSALHGGAVRDTTSARYRQWLLHKLVTWHDQFDVSGCVGCGRCISWCPVGIDLTAEVARLARAPERGATP